MTPRKLLKLLGLPFLVAADGMAHLTKGARNKYYEGPVSDHFDGKRFFTPGQPHDKGMLELLRWQLGDDRRHWPETYPSPFEAKPAPRVEGLRVTQIGHATVLIQVAGLNILTDPVFNERVSPVSFAGPKRHNPPGVAFGDLPPIDAILLTHNHYDHLEGPTLARLWRRDRPRILTPLGNDTIVRAYEPAAEVQALDWGQSTEIASGVTAHLEPAYHWSARSTTDRRRALWGAFVLTTPLGVIYHVGDTGYGEGAIFRQVRQKFGTPRLAILPIGAYEPRWFMEPQHMNPEEAVRAFQDCGADQALGHHWGTFRLTDEGIEEPPEDLAKALVQAAVSPERFHAMRPGEVWEG